MAEIRKTLILLVAVLAVSHMHAADFRRGMLLVCEGQFGADYGSLAFIVYSRRLIRDIISAQHLSRDVAGTIMCMS
jgi:hypothetical protein